ncbi:MAG: hypothetical protein LBK50_03290 [Candidatus Nomurabacteria bacterium]|jgi:hypothetical protein|nr:hypothetical protein [Candidatus Nomurabacteria bacterium]
METMVLDSPAVEEISPEIEVTQTTLEAKLAPSSPPEATSKGVGAAACIGVCAACPMAAFCASSKTGDKSQSDETTETSNDDPSQPGETTESDDIAKSGGLVTGESFSKDPDMAPTGAGQTFLDEFLGASKKPTQIKSEAKTKPISKPEPKPKSSSAEGNKETEARESITGIQETIKISKPKTDEAKLKTKPKLKPETTSAPEPEPEISITAGKIETKLESPNKLKSDKIPLAINTVTSSIGSNKSTVDKPAENRTIPNKIIATANPPKPETGVKNVSVEIDQTEILPKAIIPPKAEKPQKSPSKGNKPVPPNPVDESLVQDDVVNNTTTELDKEIIPEKKPKETKNNPETPLISNESQAADDDEPLVIADPTERKEAINLSLDTAENIEKNLLPVLPSPKQDKPKTIHQELTEEAKITPVVLEINSADTIVRNTKPEIPPDQLSCKRHETVVESEELPEEPSDISYDVELNAHLEMTEITAPVIEYAIEIADEIDLVDEADDAEEEILIERDMITVYDRSTTLNEEYIMTIRKNVAPVDDDNDELLTTIMVEEAAIMTVGGSSSRTVTGTANRYRHLIIAFLGREVTKSLHCGAVTT